MSRDEAPAPEQEAAILDAPQRRADALVVRTVCFIDESMPVVSRMRCSVSASRGNGAPLIRDRHETRTVPGLQRTTSLRKHAAPGTRAVDTDYSISSRRRSSRSNADFVRHHEEVGVAAARLVAARRSNAGW